MKALTTSALQFARVLAFFVLAQCALADTYPSQTIRLIVPFGPGGSADAIARPLAEKLGATLGQAVIVDNRPGGLTVIGADRVAKAPPDGYTLFLMPGTHVLTPYMVAKIPYDVMNDFTPVAYLGTQPYFIFSNVEQPYKTFTEMIAYAKAHPEGVAMGVSDAVTRVVATALAQAANVKMTIVAYKGGGPQSTDLLSNQIGTAVVTPNMMPFVQQGKLRALVATTPKRAPFLPDVPTVAELLPGSRFDVQTWYAIAGPAHLPPAIVQRLHDAIAKVLADPDMHKRLDDLGVVTPGDMSPDAIRGMMKAYQARMSKLLQAAGIVPQ